MTPNSFDSRKKLPAEWCGLRDGVLSEKVQQCCCNNCALKVMPISAISLQSGVPGGIFIHASGFIGGHATKEGAIEMAVKVCTCCISVMCLRIPFVVGMNKKCILTDNIRFITDSTTPVNNTHSLHPLCLGRL